MISFVRSLNSAPITIAKSKGKFSEVKLSFARSLEESDEAKWSQFCSTHPRRSIFQSVDMYRFWNRLENYEAFIFMAEDQSGTCMGFCTGVVASVGTSKTKYHDRTALIYGGALLKNEDEDLKNAFLINLEKHLKKISRFTEFRNFGRDLYLKASLSHLKWEYTPKLTYLIRLDGSDQVFERFSKSKRRQIRSTLKKGIHISQKKTVENIEAINDILQSILEKNDRTLTLPIPDLNFFKELMKLENSGLNIVRYEGKVIAGAFFVYDDKFLYHWFRGGLNQEYGFLSPDSIVDWATMEFGVKLGIPWFDFMGAGRKGWENRIRTYKSRFGGELVECGMHSKASYPVLFRIQNKIKRMQNR